jgi:glyoxylase-like metal-dependent hydrolase (beta-lactamase superfamily II)
VKLLADGLWQLRGFPPNAINVYLMGDVLVDAGGKRDERRILRQLEGREVAAHALTHVHPDHQGSSHAVCTALGIPLWCGEADTGTMENGIPRPDNAMARVSWRLFTGPPHPVERRLREGDSVAGFTVLETPGHTPGHVAYWRESDRALVLGDVLFGLHPLTGRPQLREPPRAFTPDPQLNREAIRRLAALEPALVCFGHGPPLRDPRKLAEFAAGLGAQG